MKNILVVGDAILDHYIYGNIDRQSPEDSSVSVFDVEREEYRLGGCMNVAANIRSISYSRYPSKENPILQVSLNSVFSRATGLMLWGKNIQCDDSCMAEENAAGTLEPSRAEIIKTRVINTTTKKQMIRIDNRKKFSKEDIERYKESFGDINDKKYEAVVISDYQKGLVDDFVLDKLKEFKGKVFVDTKNPDLSFWDGVDDCLIKVNSREWDEAIQKSKHPVIVTCGSKGAELRNTQDWHDTVVFPANAVSNPDVVGAGDVFLAGLVVKYMRGSNLSSAIDFANMCAGISVKKQGTTEVQL